MPIIGSLFIVGEEKMSTSLFMMDFEAENLAMVNNKNIKNDLDMMNYLNDEFAMFFVQNSREH